MKRRRPRTGRRQAMQVRLYGPSLHELAYQRAHSCCFFCGVPLPRRRMTLDHLTPVARGGASILENLVASCHACNSAKGQRTLEEYRTACGGQPFAGEGTR